MILQFSMNVRTFTVRCIKDVPKNRKGWMDVDMIDTVERSEGRACLLDDEDEDGRLDRCKG